MRGRVSSRLEQLMEQVRALPPMTAKQREAQTLDFVYGNLAASTNHRPVRDVFAKLATERWGWSAEKFDKWAEGRTWRSVPPAPVE
jgi:hypothetical protein